MSCSVLVSTLLVSSHHTSTHLFPSCPSLHPHPPPSHRLSPATATAQLDTVCDSVGRGSLLQCWGGHGKLLAWRAVQRKRAWCCGSDAAAATAATEDAQRLEEDEEEGGGGGPRGGTSEKAAPRSLRSKVVPPFTFSPNHHHLLVLAAAAMVPRVARERQS